MRTSRKAIFAVLLGLLGMVFWFVTAIPAIVLATMAKSDIRKDPKNIEGNGLATAGLVLGILTLIFPVFLLPVLFVMGAQWDTGPAIVRGDKVAHFHLELGLFENPVDAAPSLFGPAGMSLKGFVDRLDKAREDESVKGVLLTMETPAIGLAQSQEIARALWRLRDAGKPVYVHGTTLQTGSYALMAAATHLNVVPTDSIWLTGLHAQNLYLAEALDKIGVKAQVLQMGDFKAAGESFSRSGPSEAASANMNWMLDSLYASIVDLIATGRDMTPEDVRAAIDDGPYTADAALKAGLVDSVLFLDDFLENINQDLGEDVTIDNLYGLNADEGGGFGKRDQVALIYIQGPILQGYQDMSPFGGSGSAAYSGDLRRVLDAARKTDRVKAVVLRVDSPGGSAVASEEILFSVKRLQAPGKPVVVSMGNTAASGGYYVASSADAIFADAATLTASIGVVGGSIATQELWSDLGISWHSWQRGANADLLDIVEPLTEEERQLLLDWMRETYDVFKKRVTEGRGDKLTEPIDAIAGGRVYTGEQAVELGLVDELGGLHQAIEHAAELADLGDRYRVRMLPEYMTFWEAFFAAMSGEQGKPSDLEFDSDDSRQARAPREVPGLSGDRPGALAIVKSVDPQAARVLERLAMTVHAMRDEKVLVMMPETIVFR